MGRVVRDTGGEVAGGWTRWVVSVQVVYKRGARSRLRRGTVPLYVRARDLACKCPKIKSNKQYLILGVEKEGTSSGISGLAVGDRTLVLEWREEWHRRIRRLQRRASECD